MRITILENRQSCIERIQIQSDKHHSKTKRIDITFNRIKHLNETVIIDLEYCLSKQITVDLKPLPNPDCTRHQNELRITTVSTSEIKKEYLSYMLKHKPENVRTKFSAKWT